METITIDILILGSGAAGIRAALAAAEAGAEVAMVAKGPLARSGSTFSTISGGWGMQALIREERTEKNFKEFYDEIVQVGLGRCNPKLVQILVEESGPCLEDLVSFGLRFRRDSEGNYVRTRACFSNSRRAFLTESLSNIREAFGSMLRASGAKILKGSVIDLIIADENCRGAWAVIHGGELVRLNAKATVLASGGGAGIFEDHLVNNGQTGDGYALAHRAGAEVIGLEFIQFMLGIKNNGRRQFLALSDLTKKGLFYDSEDRDLLETHIPHPQIRTKAIGERENHFPFSCRDSSCLVDIALARARQEGRSISWKRNGWRQDPDPGEVVHFAHAFNGGIKIDEHGASTIQGLFAAGEVAAGPHGADRIGGCMMTATQVFGKRAGMSAARFAVRSGDFFPLQAQKGGVPEGTELLRKRRSLHSRPKMGREVRETIGKYAMVLRSEEGLKTCEKILNGCKTELEEMRLKGRIDAEEYFELNNMILAGRLVVRSALKRKESRGSHYREDFPAGIS